jgi:hypothetical protein
MTAFIEALKETIDLTLMKEEGFTQEQIEYLISAERLVKAGRAHSVEEIESELGYGVVDAAVIRDTLLN